ARGRASRRARDRRPSRVLLAAVDEARAGSAVRVAAAARQPRRVRAPPVGVAGLGGLPRRADRAPGPPRRDQLPPHGAALPRGAARRLRCAAARAPPRELGAPPLAGRDEARAAPARGRGAPARPGAAATLTGGGRVASSASGRARRSGLG